MESIQHINKEGQQQGFDEETKQKIHQQQQQSSQKTTGWRSYISLFIRQRA